MKAFIQNYTFNAAAKTITLTDFTATRPVLLERLLMVIDSTLGAIIYNAADNTVATATVTSNNVVTLSAIAGSPANGDKLAIVYDTLPGDPQSVRLAPYATPTTVLSTELNTLATAANTVASATFDNSASRYPQADVQLVLAAQGSARSTGAYVSVFMATSVDGGTTFDDVNETTSELVAVFPLDAATTARRRTVRGVTLPPAPVKFFARNSTGQALAATGNTLTVAPYFGTGA